MLTYTCSQCLHGFVYVLQLKYRACYHVTFHESQQKSFGFFHSLSLMLSFAN